MATYDIGDKSLIFKRISMFLRENYMPTLDVSDEYTLDLAKCIYEYLKDFYPNRHKYWYKVLSMPDDFLSTLQTDSQSKYFKKEYTTTAPIAWTGGYIPADKTDFWQDNAYFVEGPEYSIADIYAIGLQNGILGDGTASYNVNFQGIYTYELLGYTKELKVPSDILKLDAEHKNYTLNNAVPFIKIFDNPERQRLETKYAEETALRQSGKKTLSDREYNNIQDRIKFIEDARAYFPAVPDAKSTNSDVISFVDTGVSLVDKYNIYSWPINETILQYICFDTVITESSDIDSIAQMQLLAEAIGYVPGTNLGLFDQDFELLCRGIQQELSDIDSRVLITGYCDIFVEHYLRSNNKVRIEVY